jgi:hypothetical protein
MSVTLTLSGVIILLLRPMQQKSQTPVGEDLTLAE